jgi:hypothetical protein
MTKDPIKIRNLYFFKIRVGGSYPESPDLFMTHHSSFYLFGALVLIWCPIDLSQIVSDILAKIFGS